MRGEGCAGLAKRRVYWAEDGICRTALGTLVHLLMVLLGHKYDRDVNCHGQSRVAVGDHTLAMVAEDEAKQPDYLGLARFGS